MTAANDPAEPAPARPDELPEAQFGPHRFYPARATAAAIRDS